MKNCISMQLGKRKNSQIRNHSQNFSMYSPPIPTHLFIAGWLCGCCWSWQSAFHEEVFPYYWTYAVFFSSRLAFSHKSCVVTAPFVNVWTHSEDSTQSRSNVLILWRRPLDDLTIVLVSCLWRHLYRSAARLASGGESYSRAV